MKGVSRMATVTTQPLESPASKINLVDPDTFGRLDTPFPPVRTALEISQGLIRLALLTKTDQERYYAGLADQRHPTDPEVAQTLRTIDAWPAEHFTPDQSTPPWPRGYGAIYQTIKQTSFIHEPVQRLWRGAAKVFQRAAQIQAAAYQYELGETETPPVIPPGFADDSIVTTLDAAIADLTLTLATPTAVAPPSATPPADPEDQRPELTTENHWQLSQWDIDHTLVWRRENDEVTWWRKPVPVAEGAIVQEGPAFRSPALAIAALRRAEDPVAIPKDERIGPPPPDVQMAWRALQIPQLTQTTTLLLEDIQAELRPPGSPVPEPTIPTPEANPRSTEWTLQAANATQAIAWQWADAEHTTVHFLPKPDDPRGIPQTFPLAEMADPAQRAAVAAPAGHRFTETIAPVDAMPEAVREALRNAVRRVKAEAPATPAPSEATPAAAWSLQKTSDNQWVPYRWTADGRPEWWHEPSQPNPPYPVVWDNRRLHQWLIDPNHPPVAGTEEDLKKIPAVVAAGLQVRAQALAQPANAPIAPTPPTTVGAPTIPPPAVTPPR